MTRNSSALRRICAIAGAALAGTAAALVLASPASAHHPDVAGTARCDEATGDWVVNWKVGNSETDITARVTTATLTPRGTTVTNIAENATVPKHGTTLNGVQKVSGDTTATEATLYVKTEWIRGRQTITGEATGHAPFNGDCKKPVEKTAKPSAKFETACDSVVTVKLSNGADATRPAELTVTGKDGWSEKKSVAPGQTDVVVTVPAANAHDLTVTEGTKEVAKYARTVPADCGALPLTGVKLTAAIGGAVVLLGAGTAMFFVARRRRVRFTAA